MATATETVDPLDAYMRKLEAGLKKRKAADPGSDSSEVDDDTRERPAKLSKLDNEARRLLNLPQLTRVQRQALRRKEKKEERKRRALTPAASAPSPAIPEDNRGYQLMLKMGFQQGQGLGKQGKEGRTEPILASMKFDRSGIGVAAAVQERERAEREEIRNRRCQDQQILERLQHSFASAQSERYAAKQTMGLLRQAREILLQLDTRQHVSQQQQQPRDEQQRQQQQELLGPDPGAGVAADTTDPDIPAVNWKWGLPLVARVLRERGVRPWIPPQPHPRLTAAGEQPLLSSPPPQLPPSDHPDFSAASQLEALGPGLGPAEFHELEARLPAAELQRRLVELLEWLREEHLHCVYCGHTFGSQAELLQRCPGILEDDH